MKKIGRGFAVAFAACALCGCLALTGCNSGGSGGSAGSGSSAKPAAAAVKEPAEDPNLVSIDGYEALFKGAQIAEDSDGNPAVVLNFTFTNNGKKADSFFWTLMPTVFQDGVELEMAIVYSDPENYTLVSENDSTSIQPGNSLEVSEAYVLRDTTSPVSIEFEDIWSETTKTIEVDLSKAETYVPSAQ